MAATPPQDPLERLAALLARAREMKEIKEPTAMTLASVGDGGRPSARVVLLKDVDARGLVFYTNLESRKGREIRKRGEVALAIYWAPLDVQVRVEGRAELIPDAEADAYFATRARGSQLGAWASDQSRPLRSREELEARLAEVTARFEGKPVPRPPYWSGFLVVPSVMEFWKNRENRLHDREVYSRTASGHDWELRLLYP